MSQPKTVTTRWRQLGATTDTESDGTCHMSFHVMECDSGHDFVITLSGYGKADAGYFIGALKAALASLERAAGVALSGDTTSTPRPQNH